MTSAIGSALCSRGPWSGCGSLGSLAFESPPTRRSDESPNSAFVPSKGRFLPGGGIFVRTYISAVAKRPLIWNDLCQHLALAWRRPSRRDEIASTTSHSDIRGLRTAEPHDRAPSRGIALLFRASRRPKPSCAKRRRVSSVPCSSRLPEPHSHHGWATRSSTVNVAQRKPTSSRAMATTTLLCSLPRDVIRR